MQKLTDTTQKIPSLDGWRAIAILAVIIGHSTGFLFPLQTDKTGFLYHLLHYGYYGVDLFFGISGFLICSRLLDSEAKNGRIGFRDFYIRRVFRILPPYLAYLIFILILQLLGWIEIGKNTLVSCLFFVQNYALLAREITFYFGHFWSLAVEEHYYLFFPAALSFLTKKNLRRIGVFATLGLTIALWRAAEFRLHLIERLLPGIGFYGRTDVRLDGLVFGAVSALIWRTSPETLKSLKNLLSSAATPFGLLALFIFCILKSPPLAMLWQSLLIAGILLSTTLNPESILSKVLSISPLQWIGRMSYSLYIWNNFFLIPAEEKPVDPIKVLQNPPWNFLCLFCVAYLSHRFLEKPLVDIGRRLSQGFSEQKDSLF